LVIPIDEAGGSRTLTVATTYDKICSVVGFEPNVEDDPDKVEASWGFQDSDGRKGFLWCYKIGKGACRSWSADGSRKLLEDLFGYDRVS